MFTGPFLNMNSRLSDKLYVNLPKHRKIIPVVNKVENRKPNVKQQSIGQYQCENFMLSVR